MAANCEYASTAAERSVSQGVLTTVNGHWEKTVPVNEMSIRISFPHNVCNLETSKEELIEKVFPNIQINYRNHDWLIERIILATKNKNVYQINNIHIIFIPAFRGRKSQFKINK